MQRTNEKKDAPKEKEVIVFLGNDAKVYYFDGVKVSAIYEEIIPIIKKRKKRKKGFDRNAVIYFASTKDSKSSD